ASLETLTALLRARRPAGDFTGAASSAAAPSDPSSPGEPDPPRRAAGNYSSRQAPRGPRAPARAPRPPALRPGDGTGREDGRKGRAGGGRAGPCEVREASLSSRSGTGTRTLARAPTLSKTTEPASIGLTRESVTIEAQELSLSAVKDLVCSIVYQ
ncbi:hypothetical protein U0070_014369, partial [Myodes glareolus]